MNFRTKKSQAKLSTTFIDKTFSDIFKIVWDLTTNDRNFRAMSFNL